MRQTMSSVVTPTPTYTPQTAQVGKYGAKSRCHNCYGCSAASPLGRGSLSPQKYRVGLAHSTYACGSHGPPYIYSRYTRTHSSLAICRRRWRRQLACLTLGLKADPIMRPITKWLVV